MLLRSFGWQANLNQTQRGCRRSFSEGGRFVPRRSELARARFAADFSL
jgi:hypothetical protein